MKIAFETVVNGHRGPSPVLAGRGLLSNVGEILTKYTKSRRTVVVSDSNVGLHYMQTVLKSLREAGFVAESVCIPAGEDSKNLHWLATMWNTFHGFEITRSDFVIALGGGVVGDLTGFAAATWLRGVPVVQIPTSLLAFSDSSIGGKTAIDLPFGKNLAGAFHQPLVVIADPQVLKTLPEREFRQGMAEVVKYGCIRDEAFFNEIEKHAKEGDFSETFIEQLIIGSMKAKVDVVNEDECESGVRITLNFGHTLGHAIEKVLGYGFLPHGEAVAIGMVAAAKLGEKLGRTEKGTAERIASVLKLLKLPTCMADLDAEIFNENHIVEAMLSDKKKSGDQVKWVLLRKIGETVVEPLTATQIRSLLSEIL